MRALNWLWGMRFLAIPGGLAGLDAVRGPLPLALLHLRLAGLVLAQELEAGSMEPAAAASALLYLGRSLPCLPEAGAWWEAGRLGLGQALAVWTREAEPEGQRSWAEAVAAAEWGALALWLGSSAGAEMPGAVEGVRRLSALPRGLAPPWGEGSFWGWSALAPVLGLDPRPPKAAGGRGLPAQRARAARRPRPGRAPLLDPGARGQREAAPTGRRTGPGRGPGQPLRGRAGRKAGIHLNASGSPALALDLHLEGRPLLWPLPVRRGKAPWDPIC